MVRIQAISSSALGLPRSRQRAGGGWAWPLPVGRGWGWAGLPWHDETRLRFDAARLERPFAAAEISQQIGSGRPVRRPSQCGRSTTTKSCVKGSCRLWLLHGNALNALGSKTQRGQQGTRRSVNASTTQRCRPSRGGFHSHREGRHDPLLTL
jgi:hypothetical protein